MKLQQGNGGAVMNVVCCSDVYIFFPYDLNSSPAKILLLRALWGSSD